MRWANIFSKENDTQKYLLYIIMHIQFLDSVWWLLQANLPGFLVRWISIGGIPLREN